MKNSNPYDLNEVAKRVKDLLGTETLGVVEGITVEKTSSNDVLMLKPTAPDPVFVLSYINDIGENITIPIEATSLHISVQQGPYEKAAGEESITIPGYQD